MKLFLLSFIILALSPRSGFADETPTKVVEKENLSLSIGGAIDRALANDHDVLKAGRNVDAAHAKVSSARSKFFPKIEIGVLAGTYHDRIPQPGDRIVPLISRDRNAYNAQLTIAQPIFSGFRRSSALRRFSAEEHITDLELEIAKQRSIEGTVSLYYGIQFYEQQISAEVEVQSLREKQLTTVEHRLTQGAATDLQRLQALYAVKKQPPIIQELKAELALRYLQLFRRLNLSLDSHCKLTDIIPDGSKIITMELPPLADAFDFALKHSLTIRRLEAQADALDSQGSEAFADHLPSLSLDLNAGTNAYQRQDIATTNSLAYGAQLSLKIPLFSGLDSFSDRDYWRASIAALVEERALVREKLLNDLNDTYRRLEMSKDRIEASRINVQLTQRALQMAEQAFRLGKVSILEVFGAYSANLEAQKQTIQDAYDRIVALFHVKALLGLGTDFDKG